MSRWEYPEDRYELDRWLIAPRAGYRAYVDLLQDELTVLVSWQEPQRHPHYMAPPIEFYYKWRLPDLRLAYAWRQVVAKVLRECRRELRRARLDTLTNLR